MSTIDFNNLTAKLEERSNHLKELKEKALKRGQEAEELGRQLDEEEAEEEAEEQARIERMAAAETRVVEQMAKERAGKSNKSNGQSNGESYFNPELEKLIEMALEDGTVSEKEREVLHKKAQALGVDTDELDMVLNSRLEKLQDRKLNGGKYFIENLQKEINDVCILEMGTYGKKVEDTRATKKRREEVLLAANPTTPSEIKEYLYFLSGKMDASDYEYSWQRPYWEKFESVYTKAKQEYPSDHALLSAIKATKLNVYAPILKKLRGKRVRCILFSWLMIPLLRLPSINKQIKKIEE